MFSDDDHPAAKMVSDLRAAMGAFEAVNHALAEFAEVFSRLGYTEPQINLLLAAIAQDAGFFLS